MRALLRNLIKTCNFSKKAADDGQLPIQQISYFGKVADGLVIMPYGLHANIPDGFLGVLFAAQEQNRFILPLSAVERIKPIASGEVVLYHPVKRSLIHFKNNGDIEITTTADIKATCENASITASAAVDVACVTLTANASGQADIIAPIINLDGNVNVTGNLAVTGVLTQSGVDVGKDHTHTQGVDSAGNTEQNTGGVVP